jgi:DNA adenine methylase
MKYMGSKSKIASYILPFIHSFILANNADTYIEPFMGGCNMIDKVQCSKRLAYDKNRYLVALFQHLQDGGELPEDVSRTQYVDCRAHYKADDGYYPDWYLAAVGFLAGFNGRFYDGCYANPGYEGDTYRDYYQEAKRNILEQMKGLTDVQFAVADYKTLNPKGCIIYCDPPYSGTKGYLTITKEFNHREFWDIMREWSKDNIVLISEENAPDDFDILWEAEVMRTIRATDKSTATEKLFIHHSINTEEVGYDF